MKRKKKLCFVSGDISRSGGTERVALTIANKLSSMGYDISILSFWRGQSSFFSKNKEIKLYTLLDEKKEGKLYRTYLYPILKLRRFILKNDIDIIIDIDMVLTQYSVFAKVATKCKVISWAHFNYYHTINDKKRVFAMKCAKKFADYTVVLTKEDYKYHINKAKFHPNRIKYIYNPIPICIDKEVKIQNKVFLSVGRLVKEKGFDMLIEAWSLIEEKIPDWNLNIIGSGEQKKELCDLIQVFNLKNIKIVDHTKEIDKYYSNSCVYVLSSRNEGFPMVLLEAKAKGLPIIAFDCKTGPNEMIIHNKDGILVESENVQMLSQSMLELARDNKKIKEFSYNSLASATNFTIEKIIIEWQEIIDELLT